MVLGIWGWQLLDALGITLEVCHLNEGHAGLTVRERARALMGRNDRDFCEVLCATRPGILFTTHTSVAAGFDRFAPTLVGQYLRSNAEALGLSLRELPALGRIDAEDRAEPFNMAYLALRGSGAVKGWRPHLRAAGSNDPDHLLRPPRQSSRRPPAMTRRSRAKQGHGRVDR